MTQTIRCASRALFKQGLVASLYFLLSILILEYATFPGSNTIIWPAFGFALAVLIRFGIHFALGIFVGAASAGVVAGYPLTVALATGSGDTLGPLAAAYLLNFLPFSPNLYRFNDYVSLIFVALIGAVISALIGGTTFVYTGLVPLEDETLTLIQWWMSDVAGAVLFTPVLLFFRWTTFSVQIEQTLEALGLLLLAILIASVVLAGLSFGPLEQIQSSYLLTIPLVWSILRFGKFMTAALVAVFVIIGLWGLTQQQGFFTDGTQANLMLFWTYFIVMALISTAIAYIVNERNMLYEAITDSQVSSYIFNSRNLQFEFVNNATLADLGMTPQQALNAGPIHLKPLYDEQQFRDLLAPLENKQQSLISIETVIESKQGLYPAEVHIQRIDLISNEYYFVSMLNLSERLEKERQLRLGNQVCELTPQAIMITNRQNTIIRVNSAFTEMTGYTLTEILGQKPALLHSDRHDRAFYQARWQQLHDEGIWKGEVYSRRKSGESYLQNLTIKLLHDHGGNIENYIMMFTDISHERQQALHFKQLAEMDSLTGLPNRTVLGQRFQPMMALAKRNNKHLGLLYIDLNDFKPVNDDHGHAVGDKVLQHVAKTMTDCVRESDIVSRLGGDEFCVLVNEIEHPDSCRVLIEKMKQAIAEPITIDDKVIELTASIGMATFPGQGDTLDALLNFADLSMYADKTHKK